jgi:hypothetical protein
MNREVAIVITRKLTVCCMITSATQLTTTIEKSGTNGTLVA